MHILEGVNGVRANPGSIIDEVKGQLNRFESNHVFRTRTDHKVRTESGKAAWQDCIMSLQRQKGKSPFVWNKYLQAAAQRCLAAPEGNISEMVRQLCNIQGSFAFHLGLYEADQQMKEILAAMMVCDNDEKKSARVAIFHPLYSDFGCATASKGSKTIIFCLFAEGASEVKQKVETESEKSEYATGGFQQQPKLQIKQKKVSQLEQAKQGKLFMEELNRVRKDPKNYIHALKAEINKFKDQNTLVADYATVTLKQGQISYYDLISELETQYPLPSVRQVSALTVLSLEQVKEYVLSKHDRTPHESLLSKYCLEPENVKSFKLKDIQHWPISAVVMGMLLSDGDKKRTIRRKLMSPICKAGGCAINTQVAIINIGQSCKDRKDIIAQYMEGMIVGTQQKPKVEHQSGQRQKGIAKELISFGDKVVVRRTSKKRRQVVNGREYMVTETQVTYSNGQTEDMMEEQLIV